MANRFRMGARRWVPRPRWRAWAAALLGRHLRRTATPWGPGRVFQRPLSRPRSLVRERLLLASRTILASSQLLPQIHLAVQPVLRERFWRQRSLPAAASAGSTAVRSAGNADPRATTAISERTVERVLARPAVAAFAQVAGAPRPLPAAPPLRLVFQRLHAPQRALGVPPAARREEGPAQRVAARVRRVERQAPDADPTARVTARRASPAPAMTEMTETPAAGWRAAPPPWNGSPSLPAAPPQQPPAINVDAVADRVMQQIDHRLHAWRERTGL